MFNILSGLQEGSHSVTLVTRETASAAFVKGQVVKTDGNGKIVAAATSADHNVVEFVFEEPTSANSSKTYSLVYGSFEAETDQIDDATNGAIAGGDFVTCVGGKLAKAAAGDITAKTYCGKVISTKASTTDSALGTAIGKIIRFRTI